MAGGDKPTNASLCSADDGPGNKLSSLSLAPFLSLLSPIPSYSYCNVPKPLLVSSAFPVYLQLLFISVVDLSFSFLFFNSPRPSQSRTHAHTCTNVYKNRLLKAFLRNKSQGQEVG